MAGITSGTILAVMIPLILILVFVAYKLIQKLNAKRKNDEEDYMYREPSDRLTGLEGSEKLNQPETYDDRSSSLTQKDPNAFNTESVTSSSPRETTVY